MCSFLPQTKLIIQLIISFVPVSPIWQTHNQRLFAISVCHQRGSTPKSPSLYLPYFSDQIVFTDTESPLIIMIHSDNFSGSRPMMIQMPRKEELNHEV